MAEAVAGLAAFGLFCNIIEVVSFTSKIIARSAELQQSLGGELESTHAIRECANQLARLNAPLSESLSKSKEVATAERDADDVALEAVGQKCYDEAKNLINLLNTVRPPNALSKRKNVYYALKAYMKEDEIEAIEKRMQSYQFQADSIRLQSLSMRQKMMAAEQAVAFAKLQAQSKQTDDSVKEASQQLSNQIGLQADLILRQLVVQHEQIRGLIPARTPSPPAYHDGKEAKPGGVVVSADPKRSIFDCIERGDVDTVKEMVVGDPVSSLRLMDAHGRTPLHVAAMQNNVKILAFLIKRGAILSTEDLDGATPLHCAVRANAVQCARALYSKGADLKALDDADRTPASYAEKGSEMAYIMDRGPQLDAKDDKGDPALIHFTWSDQIEIVKSLLDQNADVDVRDDNRATPLHVAACTGSIIMVDLFLEHGAQKSPRNSREGTPLGDAALHGHGAIVQRLIDAGAEIDASNDAGWTPLIESCFHMNEAIALLLIRNGASLEAWNAEMYGAIHYACARGLTRVVTEILMLAPSNVNWRGAAHWTPLAQASHHGFEAIVALLLAHGADTEIRTETMSTPLHLAALAGQTRVISLLRDKGGAQLEARTALGRTPLMNATLGGHWLVVRHLLALGADPDAAEWAGALLRPLDAAVAACNIEMIRVLVAEGRAALDARPGRVGITPLCRAVELDNMDVAKLLVGLGADPDVVDIDPRHEFRYGPGKHYPPVCIATITAAQEILEILVGEGGADVNATNVHGWTALHEAASRSNVRALRYLLSRGADRSRRYWHPDPEGLTALEWVRWQQPERWHHIVEILETEYLDVPPAPRRARTG